MKWIEKTVVITHEDGLHMRPLETFIKAALRFNAEIVVVKKNQRANAKSMISLLALGASQGTTLVLQGRGDDAEEAVKYLAELVESNFTAK